MISIKLIAIVFVASLMLVHLASIGVAAQSHSALARDNGTQVKPYCLPTGACLDPAGRSFDVGNMPLAMTISPEGDRAVVSLSGYREQGLQVVELSTGRVVQSVPQVGAFLGLAFTPDGKSLYASGGDTDLIYRYDWRDKQLTPSGTIILAAKDPKASGTRFAAGMTFSADGRKLYVSENIADSLAVIDVATGTIEQRLKTETYPYAVAVGPGGKVFVSAWGGTTVSVFTPDGDKLKEDRKIQVGRHPSALLLNANGSRLFATCASTNTIVAIDTSSGTVVESFSDAPPSNNQGSTPDALALSPDGKKLFVAEADSNAVAVFKLSGKAAGGRDAKGVSKLTGRIPAEWYPTALLMNKNDLFVLNGKGKGTRPNIPFGQPGVRKFAADNPDYTLGQLNGTVTVLPANVKSSELAGFTKRVSRANNWSQAKRSAGTYPPFKHIIYVMKENRTYDQTFGDMPAGDGDSSLEFFPRSVSPNHHALAERFGLFDRFFCNAEVSAQGHIWTTAAYVTDYGEKTIPSGYANKRDGNDRDDVGNPAGGFIWDSVVKKGLTFRNYGEFAGPLPSYDKNAPPRYQTGDATLDKYTSPDYPGGDMKITDQARFVAWQKEFNGFVEKGNLPSLEFVYLPRDHTQGGRPGSNTPKACFADNDLALGRMIDAVSHSPYWKDTAFFILEDDAQDGPDHVDSHRSVFLTVSAYNKGGTVHRFVNTTDVFATIDEILGLTPLSQFDFYGRPLRELFNKEPDLRPYVALKPEQSLDEVNPQKAPAAQASLLLDLDTADKADEDAFNRVLWMAIKGEGVPYPQPKRMSTLEMARAR
ncbi:MAG: bifunctional YncE family protein/alkaline phosphatase family protein [Acidobacteria bacterium]|nr:bifunctional YncE family protein/alkaline phosphatase family protein [Acidobacteriota bacterium]